MSAYLVSLACVIGINMILALSLNIITGFCGQISLGHAAFYGIGAYAAALLAKAGAPLVVCLLAGTVVAGAIGTVVGLTALRVRHDFLAITTMGVGFIFLGVVRKQSWLGGELGIAAIPDAGFGPLGYAVFVLAIAAGVIALSLWLKRSWMGFAFDTVADDEDAARTVGIDVASYKLTAFGIGTAIAGLGGGLYIYFAHIILPDTFDFAVSIAILTTVVVGGSGSVWGVSAAAVLLTLLPEVSRVINDYRLLVFGAMLVLVMRFSPGGLAGAVAHVMRRRGA
ncbi:MAG: branched-chain amino acid ABC transporter permease [Proteobacteria bacterium]|nr:branched-chain amino acid ABC transporter permease [Pseudomonadota bacterium]